METILLAVTVGSLLVAFIMSAAAYRLTRAERARASARVAALAAAASRPDAHAEDAVAPVATALAPATPIAVVPIAAVATIPAPAVTSTPPPAPARARVSAFQPVRPSIAAALPASRMPELTLDAFPDELPLRPASNSAPAAAAPAPAAAFTESFLGVTSREQSHGSRQRGLAVAAAIFFVMLGGGAFWVLSDDQAATSEERAVASSASPLELISLRHERQGSRLTLSGLVRNPASGATIEGLTAVVFLFDAQGGFISSARAGVDFKRLAAGDESPFVVAVEAPANIARYRVSFRTDAGVIAHVDRRAEQAVATVIASGTK